MTVDALRLTAEQAAGLLERGEVSPAELHAAYLAAIEARDGEIHAYLRTQEEPSGAGVPVAFKDVVSTKGVETTAGSKILSGYRPVFDATVATRCYAAGLSLLGKTNMDEFAMGSSTENSAFGPSHNPWDLERVPGGSSGGSAAAVAGGSGPLGARIRTRAARSSSRLRSAGSSASDPRTAPSRATASSRSPRRLDQVGPLTKTVRDCALLYRIIAGRDECDSTTVELPEPVEIPEATDLKGLRVGVPRQLNEAEGIEPGVKASVDAAVGLCKELGAEVGECELPLSVEYGMPCYYLIAPAEASSNLARYDGVRYGLRADAGDLNTLYERTRHDGFGDEPKRRIMLGTYALSAGYYDAFYGQAQKVRTIIGNEFRAVLEDFDVLVSPTSPTVAFPLGARTENPLAMYLSDLLAIPPNMAGLPGLSIPCGLSEGLPVGLQLIGPQFSENLLFRVGHALEQAIGFDTVPERLR